MPKHRSEPRQAGRKQAERPTRGATPGTPRRAIRGPSFVQRYRTGLLLAVGVTVLVAGIVIAVLRSNTSSPPAAPEASADPAVMQMITQVPQATYDAVGTGSASNALRVIPSPPLTAGGKPEVLYIGAEYCPYCAAERWALVMALSRFGTFQGLKTTRSAPNDVDPNTATFSFYGSTYQSAYLSFASVEQYSNQPSGGGYKPLQQLSAAQEQIISTYDQPPYATNSGAIPFLDIGGTYVMSGATYDPGILANMDWQQIASQLHDPASARAKAIVGSANLLTAALCKVTGGQPAGVCQAAGTQTAAQSLPAG